MEHNIPPDPAPALTRGLTILSLLSREGRMSLEAVVRETGWPKSSVLRYLQSLAAFGAVTRDPESLGWAARLALLPSRLQGVLETAQAQLNPLADRLGVCAELYRWIDQGLILVDRVEPEGAEVAVRSKIGFTRDLEELDATSLLVQAFAELPAPAAPWQWFRGRRVLLSDLARTRRVNLARRRPPASDRDFNEYGIRRHAIPLREADGRFRGVLALAQRQTPGARAETPRLRKALSELYASAFSPPSPDTP